MEQTSQLLQKQKMLVIALQPVQKRRRHKIAQSNSDDSQRDSYFPQFNQYKKVGMEVEKKRVSSGSWSVEETKLYLRFLEGFKNKFASEEKRRKCTIFNRLSKAIRTRTPDQCRSHHQKLQNKFDTIEKIIDFLKEKVEQKGVKVDVLRPTATQECLDDVEEDGLVVDLGEIMCW